MSSSNTKMRRPLFLTILVCLSLALLMIWPSRQKLAISSTQPLDFSKTGAVVPITSGELLRTIPTIGSKVVIVNIWATWCGPCVEEFPEFVKFQKAYKEKGVSVLFVSSDFSSEISSVKVFLAEQGVDFTSYIKAEKDDAFINNIHKDWQGQLPTTLIYDGDGKLLKFIPTPLTYAQLESNVLAYLTP